MKTSFSLSKYPIPLNIILYSHPFTPSCPPKYQPPRHWKLSTDFCEEVGVNKEKRIMQIRSANPKEKIWWIENPRLRGRRGKSTVHCTHAVLAYFRFDVIAKYIVDCSERLHVTDNLVLSRLILSYYFRSYKMKKV